MRRNRILDIKTLEEDPGAAMEFARSKSTARKEGLTGVVFKDVAGLGPLLSEVTGQQCFGVNLLPLHACVVLLVA